MSTLRSLSPSTMRLMLNKRFSRFMIVAVAAVVILTLAAFWSKLPRFNGHELAAGRFPLPWSAPGKGGDAMPYDFYPFETTSSFFPVSQSIQGKTTKELCASFPSYMTQRIQPVLKMGHGEKRDKIEAQLDSVSACFSAEELLIFSDLDETIRDRPIIDILADLPDSYRVDNRDFDNYITMQELRRTGRLDIDVNATKGINGWRLDKYKFLPMVERAWTMRPGRDWYVFYETDTYVVWDNMFRFLSTLDPETPIYMGSPSPGKFDEKKKIKTWFANGGPGFVLSRGAIAKLMKREVGPTGQFTDAPLNHRWLDLLRADCCGDSVMGWVLWNLGIPLSGYFPMFNPHSMHGIPYADRYWCQPVLTLHKTTPEDMVDMWKWEHSRRMPGRPLLYSDLYEFRHPGDPEVLYDWDNGDLDQYGPPAGAKVDSAETCGKACANSPQCVQWLWRGEDEKRCILMRTLRYGIPREPEVVKHEAKPVDAAEGGAQKEPEPPKETRVDFTSGWMKDRINKWRSEHQCQVVQWVQPSITRIF